MPKTTDEDLFSSSTMTFGEHLEELRVCLTKALMALLLCSVIGFFVSKDVVTFIETPVLDALKRFHVASAKDQLRYKYGDQVNNEMYQLLDDRVMVVEEVFVEQEEATRLGKLAEQWNQGEAAGSNSLASSAPGNPVAENAFEAALPPPSMNFLKTRIWRQAEARIQSLDPWESFTIYLKASLVVGAIIGSPYIFYQLWIFVSAGLYYHERRYVYIYLPLSLFLFFSGVALAFAFVFRPVLDFLFSYNREMNIAPDMRISSIINFVLLLPLGFGISFQLPLVMFFLNRMGVVPYETFLSQWRIAVLAIFVIAMILTPSPDPTSMMLMAIPLLGLYLLGLGMMKWMPGGRNPFGDEPYRK